MYQSRSLPSNSDSAESTSSADSNKVVNAVIEDGIDAAPNPQGPWVVDTITLAEYEAQLKAQAALDNPVDDSTAEAKAAAYFDRYSDEEIDAMVVLDITEELDADGESTIQQSLNTVPDPESPSVVDTILHPEDQSQSIAQAESVAGPADDSMTDSESDADFDTLATEEIDAELNQTVVVVDDKVSDSASNTTEDTLTNVVEASNHLWNTAFYTEPGTPVFIAVSLGLALAIMLLVWNFGNLFSWCFRRRENRPLRRSTNAQKPLPLKAKEDGVVGSLKKEVDLPAQIEAPAQGSKNVGSFKKVAFAKRENELSGRAASSNSLLESELLNAQESLALVKANSQRRDSELHAKVRGLNERLSAQTDTIAKLESDLRVSEKGMATAQSEEDKRKSSRWGNVEQLEEELSNKTTAFSKLESDFLASKEALAAAQTSADERAKELTTLANSQAGEDEHRTELLSEVERLEEELSNKTTAFSKLESDFLASKEALAAARADADERAKELTTLANSQAGEDKRRTELLSEVERLEEELSSKTIGFSKLESDFLTSKEALAAARADADERAKELTTLANSQAGEVKRRTDLLSEVERLREELSNKTTAFSELESGFLTSKEALVAAQAKPAERAKELLVDLELLGEELGAQTENVTKLEADLVRAKKSLDSQKDIEKELEAEQQTRAEAFEKQLSAQTDALLKLESDLLKSEESLAAAQIKNEGRANKLQAKIKLLEEELGSQASTSAKQEADLLKAEQKLAQRVTHEQQRNAQLQTESNELEQKLRTQTADFTELNSELLNAKNALTAAQAKDAQRENEWLTNIERLEEELEAEKAASRKLDVEMLEMKEALEDQQASQTQQSQRTTELQAVLTHAEQEVEQLQLELNKEKAIVAESVEKLAASKAKVSRLRQERANAAVNRSNYMKLAKKVVRYKKLYRANEEKIKDLAEQNLGMSEFASEYLEAADGMIEELSEQAKLVAGLKQRMLQSEASNTGSERNGLAEQLPREDLLVEKQAATTVPS